MTYNMHKGRSFWLRQYKLDKIRKRISNLAPDLLFLQEIHGVHPRRYASSLSPVESIADQIWPYHCYGRNAIYQKGHHGNAVLSRHEILNHWNNDISQSRFASRGLLHAQVRVDDKASPLHLLNVHLDLTGSARQRQVHQIHDYLDDNIPAEDRVIMAGDFNDLRDRLDRKLLSRFEKASDPKRKLATFPSSFPRYEIDRIYYRNLDMVDIRVSTDWNWKIMSDHLPLIADFAV